MRQFPAQLSGGSRTWRRPLAGWIIAIVWLVSGAAAEALAAPITLLSVTGAGTTGQSIAADQGAVVSFTLDQLYTDIAISADVICVGCDGAIYLMKDLIGPTATLANLVTAASFDVGSAVDPLLSGLSLDAGDYFLIVAIFTGGASWLASDPFVLATAPGVSLGLNYFASNLDDSAPFRSPFAPIQSAASLHFAVVGEVATAPEPATSTLVAVGLGLVARQRYRRRGRQRHR